ncbi:hypothetical protein B0H39_005783 [Clostridium beijerinckii]|nr:hypothetical protein [Clostridium beijerinckii]
MIQILKKLGLQNIDRKYLPLDIYSVKENAGKLI